MGATAVTKEDVVEEFISSYDVLAIPEGEDFLLELKVLEDLNLEGVWSMTQIFIPRRFVLYDNKGDENERLIVFANDEKLCFLAGRSFNFVCRC